MSRGPGRIERAIRALLDANPDRAFTTDELCEHCYPELPKPTHVYRPEFRYGPQRKHRVAVLRAAKHVVQRDPNWSVRWTTSTGREFIWFNQASLASTAMSFVLRNDPNGGTHAAERAVRMILDPAPNLGGPLLAAVLHDQALAQRGVAEHLSRCASLDPVNLGKRTEGLSAVRSLGNAFGAASIERTKYLRLHGMLTAFAAQAAARVRALMVENDPDAIRDGLTELAETLERLGGGE
jgi:hypothetical protein